MSLAGPTGNPGGIGATLQLYFAAGQQLFYEHQPTRGYLSTHDSRAHFGLGKVSRIDSLLVRWPDGRRQVLKNLFAKPAADRFLQRRGFEKRKSK